MSTMQSPLNELGSCLSEDDVLAFQNGETTELERQRIHQHIDRCDVCRRLLVMVARMAGGASAIEPDLDSFERVAALVGSGLRLTALAGGKLLAQRFEVLRFVERGGMGEVYEAFDRVVGSRVALKTLLSTTRDDAPGVSRLGEEVKLARRVAHANVCRIHDLHEHREAAGPPLRFLAMEFVDGVTLKERLLERELAIVEACAIARQLLLGLAAIHSAGVLHLDFKSQNVMLRQDASPEQPVVMDFSLSRAFETELRLRTSERTVAGSIGYMSPEQLECQSTLGPASDVYAFGVVFYEMLTRRMPFDGNSPAAIMFKQLKLRPQPPSHLRPEVGPALDGFVLTCLGRHPRSRYADVQSALQALDRCTHAALPRRTSTVVQWSKMAATAALAAGAAGAMVHFWSLPRALNGVAETAEPPLRSASVSLEVRDRVAIDDPRAESRPAVEAVPPHDDATVWPAASPALLPPSAVGSERRDAHAGGNTAPAKRMGLEKAPERSPPGTAAKSRASAATTEAISSKAMKPKAMAAEVMTPVAAPTAPRKAGHATNGTDAGDSASRRPRQPPPVESSRPRAVERDEDWTPVRAPDFLL
jgi:serine/threonine protein kinase